MFELHTAIFALFIVRILILRSKPTNFAFGFFSGAFVVEGDKTDEEFLFERFVALSKSVG